MKNRFYVMSLSVCVVTALVACANNNVPSSSTTGATTESRSLTVSSTNRQAAVDTQRVGSAEYGYIDIPKSWLPFHDVSGGNSIQYTDGSGYNIVTLNGYTKEKANIASDEEFTAETMANRIVHPWINNENVEKMWGAKTTVSGNEAFQVNIILKSGQYLIAWVFQNNQRIYFISYEGSKESLLSFIPYIEETWRPIK